MVSPPPAVDAPPPAVVSPPPAFDPETQGVADTAGSTHVRLEVDSPEDLALYAVPIRFEVHGSNFSARGMAYKRVCTAPCNRTVDVGDGRMFFVGAEGSMGTPNFRSRTFYLDDDGPVTVHARSGRRGTFIAGIVLAVHGAALLPIGAGLAISAALPGPDRGRKGTAIAGGVMLGVGLGLGIPGTIMLLRGRVQVSTEHRRVTRGPRRARVAARLRAATLGRI